METNARFWVYENGAVKLTLRPNAAPISHETSERTDEGWSASGARYWLADDTVWREWFSDGVDCDGRLWRGGTDSCHITRLDARAIGECVRCHNTIVRTRGEKPAHCFVCDPMNPAPIDWTERYPDWQAVESAQRDYQAEAAGY